MVKAIVCCGFIERDGSAFGGTASRETPDLGNHQGSVAFQHLYPLHLPLTILHTMSLKNSTLFCVLGINQVLS